MINATTPGPNRRAAEALDAIPREVRAMDTTHEKLIELDRQRFAAFRIEHLHAGILASAVGEVEDDE